MPKLSRQLTITQFKNLKARAKLMQWWSDYLDKLSS